MRPDRSSQTAYRAAISRAAHQILDEPKVLDDPIAIRILGPEGAALIRAGGRQFESGFARRLRAFFVARSRFAEDELSQAVQHGVRQYVILGAGLDTFAYRNPHAGLQLRVFEVDHPTTQAWKRQQLNVAAIAIPGELTFVPVDFETQSATEALRSAGFRADEPAFFSWLGVSMYLTPEIVMETMKFIVNSTTAGGGIVFDYVTPLAHQGFSQRLRLFVLTRWLAAVGEPWRAFFDPQLLTSSLKDLGFACVKDMGAADINDLYFDEEASGHLVRGPGRLISAWR